MARLVDLLGSFPTVMFTALLVFCLASWLVSLAVSGLEGDAEFDLPSGGSGSGSGSGSGAGSGRGTVGLGVGGANARGFAAAAGHGSRGGRGPGARLSRAMGLGSVPLTLGLTIGSFSAWATSLLASLVSDDWSSGPRTAAGAVVAAGAVGGLCRVRTVEVSDGDA
ncbi:MAG: hypothetical protein ACKV2O_11700 [Acidimicrobiales bacterium]